MMDSHLQHDITFKIFWVLLDNNVESIRRKTLQRTQFSDPDWMFVCLSIFYWLLHLFDFSMNKESFLRCLIIFRERHSYDPRYYYYRWCINQQFHDHLEHSCYSNFCALGFGLAFAFYEKCKEIKHWENSWVLL